MSSRKDTITLLREYSIPLIAGVFVALIWANIAPHSYHHLLHHEFIKGINFHFFVNDIFMVFFFAIAAVHITMSLLPGGDLNPLKKAINPILATLGGVFGPVAAYMVLNSIFGSPEFVKGWGIPTATDIALAWLVARMVFGAGHPAVSFLLLLAIADDAIGLGIIAIFYPDPHHPVEPIWLLVTLLGMAAAFALRKFKVKSYWPYLLIGGLLSWNGLHSAHLHPALALVFIIPFLPHDEEHSTLHHFEHQFSPFVDFGLFMFGLANAGVQFSEISNVTWIVFFALLIGKSVGIFTFGFVAKLLGFPLPTGMGNKELFTAGVVAAMGLTVALFVAGVAFVDPGIQGAAKMGALFSGVVALISFIVAKVLGIKKITDADKGEAQELAHSH